LIGVVFFLPESPRWMLGNSDRTKAISILIKIRGYDDVADEVKSIEDVIETDRRIHGNVFGFIIRSFSFFRFFVFLFFYFFMFIVFF